MSNWRGDRLLEAAVVVLVLCVVFVAVAVAVVFVAVGVVFGVVGVVVFFFWVVLVAWVDPNIGGSVRERRRGSQTPADLRTVPPLAVRSLRWVRGLLPGDEGAAWLAEVTSCLAETTDKGERRRYVRSYRPGVPRLIWISWTEHLSASRQRELL